MRPLVLSFFLFLAVLVPNFGNAQVAYRPTPVPQVAAASATWQINGEPIFFGGSFYYPSGPTVFFDGQLMQRIGEYLTVPVYADTTLEAFSVIFIPIGGWTMKPYERKRAGMLAGTTGSSTPFWPVHVSADVGRPMGGVGNPTGELLVVPEAARPVGTSGVVMAPRPAGTLGIVTEPSRVERTAVQSIPRPTRNTGFSVEFQGSRWVSAGPTVPYSADRFVPIGDHHGFPVYRERTGSADTIYVTVVQDGPLAPYSRR